MSSYCDHIRGHFSSYLDGAISGAEMQVVATHLEHCSQCAGEFTTWRTMQHALTTLGPAKAPADLALRLRVAVSQEHSRSTRQLLARWKMRWRNTIGPLVWQTSAGLVSTVILLGTLAMMVGVVASPEPLVAADDPLGAVTSPRFLYSVVRPDTIPTSHDSMLMVEAYVNGSGRVYDYHILAGPNDLQTRRALENMLLFSVYAPARVFGRPVRGRVVLSFSGISVRG
jgi:hypothetical protein